jgi:hypothetical protein
MVNSKRGCGVWACVLASVFLAGLAMRAAGQEFTKIADYGTPIPGGTGTFTTLTQPQVHQGNVVFGGAGTGASGIYRFDPGTGARSVAVDTSAGLPGGGSPLLNTFSAYGNDVSLMGFSGASSGFGLYTTRGGTLHKVPGTDAFTVLTIAPTSTDAQRILFHKEFSRTIGQPTIEPGFAVVNVAEAVSNGIGQTPVYKFIARDGGYAYSDHFRYTGTRGNYRIGSTDGELWWFADGSFNNALWPSHKLPGEPETSHTWSGGPPIFSYDGDTLAFFAQASSTPDLANSVTQRGFYTKDAAGQVRTVANDDTPVPGGTGTFTTFANVTIDNGNVVFIGGPSSTSLGIFAASGGTVTEVIGVGDALDGKSVSALSFSGDRPLSGNDLVFTAEFTDGSKGLFLTQVPEPAALSCVAAIAILLARRRG